MPKSLEKKKEERAAKVKINVKNYRNKIHKNRDLHLRLKQKENEKKVVQRKLKKNRHRLNLRTGERKEKENKSIERSKNQNLLCRPGEVKVKLCKNTIMVTNRL